MIDSSFIRSTCLFLMLVPSSNLTANQYYSSTRDRFSIRRLNDFSCKKCSVLGTEAVLMKASWSPSDFGNQTKISYMSGREIYASEHVRDSMEHTFPLIFLVLISSVSGNFQLNLVWHKVVQNVRYSSNELSRRSVELPTRLYKLH